MNDAEVREPRDAEAPEPRVRSFYERTRGRRFMRPIHTLVSVPLWASAPKARLLVVHAAFAAYWGFVNAATFAESGRFASMMTGNVYILGGEILRGDGRAAAFTLELMACFLAGAATFRAAWRRVPLGRRQTVIYALAAAVVILAGVADALLRARTGSYYCLSLAAIAGALVGGYCSSVPRGVETNLVTMHFTKIAALLAATPSSTAKELETAASSLTVIMLVLVGSVAGWAWSRVESRAVPVFTLATTVVALCLLEHYRQAMIVNARPGARQRQRRLSAVAPVVAAMEELPSSDGQATRGVSSLRSEAP